MPRTPGATDKGIRMFPRGREGNMKPDGLTVPYNVALAEELAKFYDDPLGHVMFSYPWDSYAPIQQVRLPRRYHNRFDSIWGPDLWACEFLDDLGDEIRDRGFDGVHAVDPIQFATSSGHGIGKSTLSAWLIKFIMDTRPFAKGVVTANTADQLRTKTWAELGKWHTLSLTRNWFDYNSGRGSMSLTHRKHKETWRCDAYTSREENSEAFAGLHAANSTPFYLFDEASGIAEKIFEVREGGLTDGEPMVFDFGNPTRKTGRFFENCRGKFAKHFKVRQIDSRTVSITNKKLHKRWAEDYGEDSDFFKVRVRGEFPSAGSTQFIPTDVVEEAIRRELVPDRHAPLVIGVDVARFGNNDSVIYPRVGNDARTYSYRKFQGLDTVQLAGKVIEVVNEFKGMGLEPSAIFVDETGIGGGVVDQLRHLGYAPIGVTFGSKPTDEKTYRFKSDEIWGRLRDGLKSGLCLPRDTRLFRDLTQREFGYTLAGNKIHLEPKDLMAERGIDSPDVGDALAITYAQPVAPRQVPHGMSNQPGQSQHEYDPLDTNW